MTFPGPVRVETETLSSVTREPDLTPAPGFPQWFSQAVLAAPTPRLLIQTSLYQHCLSLTAGSNWTIGRDSTNSLVLPDQLVSRQHAVMRRLPKGGFGLMDLESSNGSFVNGQRVSEPTLLKHGDQISLGSTEIYFQCSEPAPIPSPSAAAPPKVLLIQSSRMQGQIWREILSSQGITVFWSSARSDVVAILQQLEFLGLGLPDLLLLDIGSQRENPYDFCRWCRLHYEQLRVILTSGMRTMVYKSERKWAHQQGAYDLFPGFHKPSIYPGAAEIIERVKVVLDALEVKAVGDTSLGSTLRQLQEKFGKTEVSS
jgi:pSer/pThr/pTyr-binding forkhead associated (FHA) protein